ncbi:MAG: hypothetical protein ACK5LV_00420 [Lachnospirales bacterium]
MAHPRTRRHYRVAEKEITRSKGTVIPEDKTVSIIAFGVIILIVVFINGMLLGREVSK